MCLHLYGYSYMYPLMHCSCRKLDSVADYAKQVGTLLHVQVHASSKRIYHKCGGHWGDIFQGGMYVFQLFDYYSGSRIVVLVAFFQVAAIAWIYGKLQKQAIITTDTSIALLFVEATLWSYKYIWYQAKTTVSRHS